MEEQMEFTYPVCGDVVGRVITGQGVTGSFRESWYTESHLLSGNHDSWLRVDPNLRKQWDLAETLDVIRGVDSLTDILEAIRLYDKYHDKEGRGVEKGYDEHLSGSDPVTGSADCRVCRESADSPGR